MGAMLAFAIAVHNIPEGLAVAVPMYFATNKNTLKTILYVAVSALAEPIAAVLTWLFLAPYLNDVAFGVLFGAVAGVMTLVSFQELLPEALIHDPKNKVTTISLVVGMAIMASSLVAFGFS